MVFEQLQLFSLKRKDSYLNRSTYQTDTAGSMADPLALALYIIIVAMWGKKKKGNHSLNSCWTLWRNFLASRKYSSNLCQNIHLLKKVAHWQKNIPLCVVGLHIQTCSSHPHWKNRFLESKCDIDKGGCPGYNWKLKSCFTASASQNKLLHFK